MYSEAEIARLRNRIYWSGKAAQILLCSSLILIGLVVMRLYVAPWLGYPTSLELPSTIWIVAYLALALMFASLVVWAIHESAEKKLDYLTTLQRELEIKHYSPPSDA